LNGSACTNDNAERNNASSSIFLVPDWQHWYKFSGQEVNNYILKICAPLSQTSVLQLALYSCVRSFRVNNQFYMQGVSLMRKRLFFMVAAMWLFYVLTVSGSVAQSSEPKVDIVGQYTLLRSQRFSGNSNKWQPGGGGVFAYHILKSVSLEAAVFGYGKGPVIFAGEAQDLPRPELQGLFGVKVGVKREKYGAFGKLRPGFTRLAAAQNCDGDSFTSCRNEHKKAFTIDYGGVFEVYPVRRIVVRVDVGAAYTSYPDRRVFIPSEPGSNIPFPGVFVDRAGASRNLFQISIGAGFRF
jgi:hypothetical protein